MTLNEVMYHDGIVLQELFFRNCTCTDGGKKRKVIVFYFFYLIIYVYVGTPGCDGNQTDCGGVSRPVSTNGVVLGVALGVGIALAVLVVIVVMVLILLCRCKTKPNRRQSMQE